MDLKKAAVFIIIILMLFSFTACANEYANTFIAAIMGDKQKAPMAGEAAEYLLNSTLPYEYELRYFFELTIDPENDDLITKDLDVIKTKTSKEFLYTEEKSMEDEDPSDYKSGDLYINAQYFDGKKLYCLDGITKKITSKAAEWEDYDDYDYLPDTIRSNIKEIISKAEIIGVEYYNMDYGQDNLNYEIIIKYNMSQINSLKIFDKDISSFEIIATTNKEATEFGNFEIYIGYDDVDYSITFGDVTTSPDYVSLKEQFDYLKYENVNEY